MPESVTYNTDCLEYLKTVPDKAFDLAVVDPPYGGGFTEGGGCKGWFSKYHQDSGGEVRKKIISWDVAPGQEYFDELSRVSRGQIVFGGNYFGLPPTRCFIVWRKTNIPLEGFTMAPCEYAWTSFNRNAMMFEWPSQGTKDQPRWHPTAKPVQLYRWIYKNFAKPGDKILDTHLGSGSSRVAAYEMGLDFTGCELDKYYFKKQEEWFSAYMAQMSLFH